MTSTPVFLEVGMSRSFAAALDWPGWCRSGKTPEAALEALAVAAPRYALVVAEAGQRWPRSAANSFDVAETVTGTAGTNFGVAEASAQADERPMTAAVAKRQVALLSASWVILDRAAASASAQLRKGPRGGGRDRDAVVAHVIGAEYGYARMLGVRHRSAPPQDLDALRALRAEVVEVLSRTSDGSRLREPKGWRPRYALRRFTWHVLDHAWEIQDKSLTGSAPG